MVDITNLVFTKIKAAVITVVSTAKVEKTFQPTSTVFPAITIIDLNNPEISHTLDYKQRKSKPSWQIDIYMNGGTRETVAKKIAAAIAKVMEDDLRMNRVEARPIQNTADTSIYRYMMRYDCTVDEDTGNIYS